MKLYVAIQNRLCKSKTKNTVWTRRAWRLYVLCVVSLYSPRSTFTQSLKDCFRFRRFTGRVMSNFALLYFILIVIGAGSISVCMFRVSSKLALKIIMLIQIYQSCHQSERCIMSQIIHTLETTCDWRELFMVIGTLIGHFLYMFFANYVAQEVTDHCNDLFLATWVLIQIESRVKILILH